MNLHPVFSRATILRVILLGLTCLSALLLICYSSITNAGGADKQKASSATGLSPTADEANPEHIQERLKFLNQFLGTGGGKVSPEGYGRALASARRLPVSPLVTTWVPWALSPMYNDWGHHGDPCTTPYPTPTETKCGASARIDAIAVDPTNADVAYVGTEGGLSKTTDGGEHWAYLSDILPSQSISSIAVDPVAPNIIYAGTGTNPRFGVGIYRSFSSGGTWANLGISQFTGKKVCKIAIDPATAGSQTSTTLYASVTGGHSHTVWRSTDSGGTWSSIKGPTANAGDFYDIAIQPVRFAASNVYVTAPNGVFKSPNWTVSIHPVPKPSEHSYLALGSRNTTIYFAFKASNGSTSIDRSLNNGSNWAPLPAAPCVPQPPNPPFCAGLDCFGVNPFNSQIFVGGGIDLVYSLDAGQTWIRSHDVHVDMHSIAFCPTNSQRNYLGTDGGIYRADYTGGSEIEWWSKNTNLAGSLMYGLSISSDRHVIMGNQDNGTQFGWVGRNPPWQFAKGGDGWKPKINPNDSTSYYYVYYMGDEHETCDPLPRTLRVGPNSEAPSRILEGGYANKTPTGAYCEASSFFPAMFVAPGNWKRVIMGFQKVWRSTNSGESWTRIGPDQCVDSSCATFTSLYEAASDTNVIYAIAGNTRVWVTFNANDANPTWADRTGGLPPADETGGIQAVTIDPTNPQIAYIAHNRVSTDLYLSGLFKTTNGGVSWTSLGFANLGCWDVAIDPANTNNVFVATGAGVYVSTDGGTNWEASRGIPAGMAVTSLSLDPTSRALAASTYGRGVYVTYVSQ